MKRCTNCNELKELEEFNRDRSRSDGRQAWCRECNRSRSRRFKLDNPELARLTRETLAVSSHPGTLE